jgi:hypothetical protein
LLRLKPVSFLAPILILLIGVCPIAGESPSSDLDKLLPTKVGEFYQVASSVRPLQLLAKEGLLNPETPKGGAGSGSIGCEAEYLSRKGEKFLVEFVQFHSDAEAYSLLTIVAKRMNGAAPTENIGLASDVGTASVASSRQIAFFKGTAFVRVSLADLQGKQVSSATDLARLFAGEIDKGDSDIPVLVKHLPDWQIGQKHAVYLSNVTSLEALVANQPVLTAVTTEGDADAVVSNYGSSKLLIVEFNTPQLAGENDHRIFARIQELWRQGQPAPSAYRRVGNYSVFVFEAPSEESAKALIDQVKYEQVVQWLGENPYILKEAQRRYVETTLGVFLAVVKASGVAALACFAVGGFLGALLFSRRRAQQRTVEAFSDAGGMLRLNIDELTPQTDASKLLSERN